MSRGKVLSRPPRGAVFEDGIEDREQLTHAGHQCHLLRFAGRQKTLVEFLHYRVATRGDQGAHIQRPSDLGSTSPHATMAVSRSRSVRESSFLSHLMWALMRLAIGLAAEDRRLFSAAGYYSLQSADLSIGKGLSS